MSRDGEHVARSTLPAPQALEALLSQHAELRAMIERCEDLADDLDRGAVGPATLTREVACLRRAFDVHNRCEARLLRPLLAESGALAEIRIELTCADHIDEHRLVRTGLEGSVVEELRTTLARLREHLVTEERCLLSRRASRSDAIVVENGG